MDNWAQLLLDQEEFLIIAAGWDYLRHGPNVKLWNAEQTSGLSTRGAIGAQCETGPQINRRLLLTPSRKQEEPQ